MMVRLQRMTRAVSFTSIFVFIIYMMTRGWTFEPESDGGERNDLFLLRLMPMIIDH